MADYVDSKTAAQEVDLAAREFADNVDKALFDPNLHEAVRKAILTSYAAGVRLASKLVMKSMEEGGSMAYVEIMDLYNELVLKSDEGE
jgi:hypothetical protein